MKKRDEYDWLEDPFTEKGQEDHDIDSGMSKGSKLAIGLGCLAVIVILIAVLAVSCTALLTIAPEPVTF